MQFYSLVVARVEAETHDVRRDFVGEARTREYFLKHGHEARGVRLFIRSPGAGRRDFGDVLARRSRMRVIRTLLIASETILKDVDRILRRILGPTHPEAKVVQEGLRAVSDQIARARRGAA